MPGPTVDIESIVLCFHGGISEPIIPYPRALIEGALIVCQDSPYTIEGCVFPPPPIANGPCIIGEWLTGAFRVFGEGIPVLTEIGEAVDEISGTGLLVPFANPELVIME